MRKLRGILGVLAVTALLVQMGFVGQTQAAGNAVITVEPSASTITTNSNVVLNFYVTATGANIYSTSFNVNLGNLTFQSYNPSGTAFNGISSVPTGGSAGSTSFAIAASYSGNSSGSGKLLVGRATVRSAASAGQGTISISGQEAYNPPPEFTVMSASAQNGSITISNPPTSAPPPSSPSPSPSPSTPSGNTSQNPNPDSSVAIPGPEPNGEPTIISEEELVNEISEVEPVANDEEDEEDTTSFLPFSMNFTRLLFVGLPLIAAAVLGVVAYRLWDYRRNSVFHAPKPPVIKDPVPQSPTRVTQSTPSTGPISQEPVIITPEVSPAQPNGNPPDANKT